MAIAQVSSSSAPVPAKGVSFDFKPQKTPETVISQENEGKSQIKTGVGNQNLNELKSVEEVNAKV